MKDLLPSSQSEPKTWKYSLTKPEGTWMQTSFADASWNSGQAGFGSAGTPGGNIKTNWTTSDIWLRQEFTLGDLSAIKRDELVLYIHHDEDCEVYINGVKAAVVPNYTSSYSMVKMSKESQDALVSNGKNVIAIHCHQTNGGQYIDAGISILSKK